MDSVSVTGANTGATTYTESDNAARLRSVVGPRGDRANHLMADASVHSFSKQMDVAAYMFMITKNGGDPCPTIP